MRLSKRGWVVLAALVALVLVTLFGPALLVAAAWVLAALALVGAGLGSSPSIQLRGNVDRIDPGARPPDDDAKRPG
jgi:hypothetical protein